MAVTATGGTITEVDGYKYHTFLGGDSFIVTAGGDVEMLIVAGGGAGGANAAGGGGGGGVRIVNATLGAGTYVIEVGDGGLPGLGTVGYDGGQSIFDVSGTQIVATGGGGGGGYEFGGGTSGRPGGSGGGGQCYSGSHGAAVTPVQGYDGGDGSPSPDLGGGGGGGAGGVGANGVATNTGGDGGIGIEWPAASGIYYAGGGGGGGYTPGTFGIGQAGGGNGATVGSGLSATANTGSGGGGGAGGGGAGGNGGSGIIIIRYLGTPTTKYWVGNSGEWDDTAHWSLTSGGSSGESDPSLIDTAVIDENSFTTTGQTIGDTPISVNIAEFIINPAYPITIDGVDFVIASGTITAHDTTLIDSDASGGATFNAFTSDGCVDGGGNTGWNFTSPTHTISGTITGVVVEGVTVDLTGDATDSVITYGYGTYSFTGIANGSYVVTPSLTGYMFNPTSISVEIIDADSTGNDFVSFVPGDFNDSLTLTDVLTKVKTRNLISIGIAISTTMLVGSSQQASAIGYYDDGTSSNITHLVTWESSESTVASIDGIGLISALKTGITFISASMTTVAYGEIKSRIALYVVQLDSSIFIGETAIQHIQISALPNQTFNATLTVDGKKLTIRIQLRWNIQAQYWVMSIINIKTGDYYVDDIPLMAGVMPTVNLLQPHNYLKIGSCYIVNISGTDSDIPDQYNLGSDFILLWGDTET